MKKLEEASHTLAQKMYEQQQADPSAGGSTADASQSANKKESESGDGVVDADFTVVDDEDNKDK